MALLIRKNLRDPTKYCPICHAKISKRHFIIHLTTKCRDRYGNDLHRLGLMFCPYNDTHIVPKEFINDHLERHCDEVKNNITQILQDPSRYNGLLTNGGPVSILEQLMNQNSIEGNINYIKEILTAKKTAEDAIKKVTDEPKAAIQASSDANKTNEPASVKVEPTDTDDNSEGDSDNIHVVINTDDVVNRIKPSEAPEIKVTGSSDPRLKRGASYGTIPFTKMRRFE